MNSRINGSMISDLLTVLIHLQLLQGSAVHMMINTVVLKTPEV
jgi:hypothetical protein